MPEQSQISKPSPVPASSPCEVAHHEKETLSVDVILPAHAPRVTTPLFSHTRAQALIRDGGRCFVCERTAEEAGLPLEEHHWLIERSTADAADWTQFRDVVFKLESLIIAAADYCRTNETIDDIMAFVDDMLVNGMTLCKEHHTAPGTGVHTLPMPLWLMQAHAKVGYQFTSAETIIHDEVSVTVPASDTATSITVETCPSATSVTITSPAASEVAHATPDRP